MKGFVKQIDIKKIDPSPFQHRKYMNEDKLKGLALSIVREGLIEPVIVRTDNGRFQLIAGERRWRAVRDYTDLKTIQAKVIEADDIEARRIAAAENIQREDLSAIETIEAIVDIVDDYTFILKKGGWETTHIIQSPMSSERFNAGVVAAMQRKRILGVTSRHIIVARKRAEGV